MKVRTIDLHLGVSVPRSLHGHLNVIIRSNLFLIHIFDEEKGFLPHKCQQLARQLLSCIFLASQMSELPII